MFPTIGAWRTAMMALPCFPSLVALIATLPTPTPFTRPAADTIATLAAPVLHATDGPLSVSPTESRRIDRSCSESPWDSDAAPGQTVTDASGPVLTVIVAEPVCCSLVAVIVALPAVTAATRP